MIHLTFDQDWAPEWATNEVVAALSRAQMRGTFFVTHACAALARLKAVGVELGWHPNFLAGSSHGGSIDDVLGTMQSLVPDAQGARAHCLIRGTPYLNAYQRLGLIYDASDLHDRVAHLKPFVSWTGLVRIPIFFEDDVHLERGLTCDLTSTGIKLEGLKVYSFHPVLLALNACSLEAYQDHKAELTRKGVGLTDASPSDFEPFINRSEPGVRDVFHRLLGHLETERNQAGGTLAQLAKDTLVSSH